MSTITLSMPDEIKNQLQKEPNQSALVNRLLLDHFTKDEKDEFTDEELELQDKELRRRKKEKKKYKINICSEWIMENYVLSVEESLILATKWIETMFKDKTLVNILDFMILQGFIRQEIKPEKK